MTIRGDKRAPLALSGPLTHKPAHAAVTAIKDALHEARYHCPGEAAGIVEAFLGPGAVPLILVQTYDDGQGVEVYKPIHNGIKTADTLEALKLATTPAPVDEHPDTDLHRAGCTHCQYVHDSKQPDTMNAVMGELRQQGLRPREHSPNPAECVRLCEALAAFWGDGVCDAPIWPGAYLTEEDTPIRDLVRAAVGWRKP